LLIASACTLAGCTSPRNTLGTADSRCFKVLPEARSAVHGKGRFSGVRYVTLTAFNHALHHLDPQLVDFPVQVSHRLTAVCIVAYSGHFEAADVLHAWTGGATSGRLALVLMRPSDASVLATVVLPNAPLRFTRVDPLDL
jgi:hypothetical protein